MKKLAFQATALAAASLSACAANGAESTLPTVYVTETRAAAGGSLGLDQHNGTGSRLDLTARETPASVSSLGSADIAERGLTRAQDVAIRLPGVTEAPAPGNGGTSLVARGFAGHNSVAQMVDGTRLVVASGTITYPFSSWPLESVEVLRGPASVLYGDGAIGAAVNYVTRRPRFDRSKGEAFLGAASYGGKRGGVGLSGPLNDMLAYSVYADAEKNRGYRRDMAAARQNLSAALTLRPDRALNVTLSLDAGHNDDAHYYGTPLRNGQLDARLRRSSFNVADARAAYRDRVWRVKVEYQAAPNLRLRNETYYLNSDRHWRNAETYTFNAAGTQVNRSDYLEILHDQQQRGNRFDASVDGQIAGRKNRFVAGFDWYRTKLLHSNNAPYGGASVVNPEHIVPGNFISPVATLPGRRSELTTAALFAENVLDIAPQWKLVAGLRRDQMSFDNHDLRSRVSLAKQYAPVTGRVGAIWAPDPALSLYSQYGTGTDPLSGALSLPNGSTNNDLTRGRQLEVGAKGGLPALKGEWTVALYKIEKRNLLSRDPDNANVTLQIGQQSSTGLELAFAAEPVRGWSVDANVALLRARYDSFNEIIAGKPVSRSGNTPTGVPERVANLWTAYRFLPQWQAALGARYTGKRQSNTANTASLPGYAVLDASLAYTPSPALALTLAVKNLADRDYAVSGSGGVRWLLGAPRSVQLTAHSNF
ncbi:TonB-dependent receptor [Janthinobacterium fluminis]|uniref:TonB-dependent siderophore receptor n=1 Tax=Janthinobacterium fluminis TaxID=2987524 RepID=A0ABT5K117_9BURK|nr:TonB-dependent siderophore receptor [Janthinobacterium fluminis]MDC8758672.1 TonB-dependent siderophore receptor [Janthinobacterium fluminis]